MRTLFLAMCCLSALRAQPRFVRIGDLAPPLKLATVVQGKSDLPSKGRAAFIEFWAASCPFCVASIPHINELAREFRNQPIDFVWINTYESSEVVGHFLKEHPMDGTVATDRDSGSSATYGLEAIPVAVLISPAGQVAAIGHPSQISATTLDHLLAGQNIQLMNAGKLPVTSAIPKWHSQLTGRKLLSDESALVRVAVVPTTVKGILTYSSGQLDSTGSALPDLLAYAYDIPVFRIVLPELLAQERYEVQAWVPADSRRQLSQLLQVAVQSAAGITVKREMKPVDAFVLDGLPGKLERSNARLATSDCEQGVMAADGSGLDLIRDCMEQWLHRTVLIPSGSSAKYRFELHWNPSVPGAFQAALKDQLGLSLRPVRQPAEVLVVEPLSGN